MDVDWLSMVISCISFPRLSIFSKLAFDDVLQFDHTCSSFAKVVGLCECCRFKATTVTNKASSGESGASDERQQVNLNQIEMSGRNQSHQEIVPKSPYQTFFLGFWMRCWLISANKVTCCSLLFFLPMPQPQAKIDGRKMLSSWIMYFF